MTEITKLLKQIHSGEPPWIPCDRFDAGCECMPCVGRRIQDELKVARAGQVVFAGNAGIKHPEFMASCEWCARGLRPVRREEDDHNHHVVSTTKGLQTVDCTRRPRA